MRKLDKESSRNIRAWAVLISSNICFWKGFKADNVSWMGLGIWIAVIEAYLMSHTAAVIVEDQFKRDEDSFLRGPQDS